jgi:hypothetical protein
MCVARHGESLHRKSRLMGYLEFYRSTQTLRRLPMTTLAFGEEGRVLAGARLSPLP